MSNLSVTFKTDNSAFLLFLIISPYPYFKSVLEHNSATVRNISMILGGFIEQVNPECHIQKRQLCLSTFFLITSPDPYFLIHFRSITLQLLEIF